MKKAKVYVRLKTGVLDVQGKAVEHAVEHLGFNEVSNVRIGKLIEFDIDAAGPEQAKAKAEEICQQFLVNPIIESFEVEVPE